MASPEIQRGFATSYAELGLVLMLLPSLVGLVFEPPLFLLADRWPRRRLIAGGLAAMAVALAAAALAPGPWTLSIALSLAGVANGVAMNLAQATLVDLDPAAGASTLARWTLWSLAGDLAAPIVLAALVALGGSWRTAVGVVVVVVAALALGTARARFPAPAPPADAVPSSSWAAFKHALRQPRVIAWLFATALCDLLDEILVVLAALHLRDDLGASLAWRGAVIVASIVGGAIGLVVIERLARRIAATRLMAATALACSVVYTVWMFMPSPLASMLMMVLVGATAVPLYPLAAAEAYAALPGRSGAVLAAGHLFTPLTLALPWLLGLVADHAGIMVALGLLVIEPLGLAALSYACGCRRSSVVE